MSRDSLPFQRLNWKKETSFLGCGSSATQAVRTAQWKVKPICNRTITQPECEFCCLTTAVPTFPPWIDSPAASQRSPGPSPSCNKQLLPDAGCSARVSHCWLLPVAFDGGNTNGRMKWVLKPREGFFRRKNQQLSGVQITSCSIYSRAKSCNVILLGVIFPVLFRFWNKSQMEKPPKDKSDIHWHTPVWDWQPWWKTATSSLFMWNFSETIYHQLHAEYFSPCC